jgi:hypothetical protein
MVAAPRLIHLTLPWTSTRGTTRGKAPGITELLTKVQTAFKSAFDVDPRTILGKLKSTTSPVSAISRLAWLRAWENSNLIDSATFKSIEDFAIAAAVSTVDATMMAKW